MAVSIYTLRQSIAFSHPKHRKHNPQIAPMRRRVSNTQRCRPLYRHTSVHKASFMDTMPTWTLDQIAGLAFGVLLVVLYFSSGVVDSYIARVQRAELGLCEECGGLYDCENCPKANCPLRTLKE